MIDPALLEEFNAGTERAKNAYWHTTSPIAEQERTFKRRERNRRIKARSRAKARRGRAA